MKLNILKDSEVIIVDMFSDVLEKFSDVLEKFVKEYIALEKISAEVIYIEKFPSDTIFFKGTFVGYGYTVFDDNEIRRIDFKIDHISDAISYYNTDELSLANNQLGRLVEQCYAERYNGYICSTKLYNVIKLSNTAKVPVSCDCVYHSTPSTGVMIIDLRDKHSVRPYLANRLVNKYSNPFAKEAHGISVQNIACTVTNITYIAGQKIRSVNKCICRFLHFSFRNIVYAFYMIHSSTIYLLQSVDSGSDMSLLSKIENSQQNSYRCSYRICTFYCGNFAIASFSVALTIKLLEVFAVE